MHAPSLRILNSECKLVADLDRYGELCYNQSLAETVIKFLVESQCGPCAAPERQFPGLAIAPDLARGCHYSLSCNYSSLLSELGYIAAAPV